MASSYPPSHVEVHTPSSLNRLVRDLLEDSFGSIWIEGELSGLAHPASGHLYFTLKDRQAQLRCAMFRPQSGWLRFAPVNGQQVLLRARAGLYEARGEFQLVVEHMELAGAGALAREFERLKAQLDAEGLFNPTHKRPLPLWPRRIGVISSPSGAAIRDVLSVWQRRFPLLQAEVLPVPVQGREAPPAIIEMLNCAVRAKRYDLLLLTRGGGSPEDLAAFNDEALARAIHACPIPLVAAIGHEIDFTIADFVADLRAPTPSAAAELIAPDSQALHQQLAQLQLRLIQLQRHQREQRMLRLDSQWLRLRAQQPQARLSRGREQLATLRQRLAWSWQRQQQALIRQLETLQNRLEVAAPQRLITSQHHRLDETSRRLQQALQQRLERERTRLNEAGRSLHAISPLATLERGYAILLDEQGQALRNKQAVLDAGHLRARLADGEVALQTRP